jgi:hypothetical protein
VNFSVYAKIHTLKLFQLKHIKGSQVKQKSIFPILFLLSVACNTDTGSSSITSTPQIPDELSVPPSQIQQVDFDQPTPNLIRKLINKKFGQREETFFNQAFKSSPHLWLDLIYSHFDEHGIYPKELSTHCDLITQLQFSENILKEHHEDRFSVKEFPLWYHNNIDNLCSMIRRLDQEISKTELNNGQLDEKRSVLKEDSKAKLFALIAAELQRDEVAKKYWLLKGFLVNPGESVYEISIPNLFESRHLICTSSTDCSSMRNINAKIKGGVRDRILLNSLTRYNSKGKIEMLVQYDSTKTLYTNSGRKVEWAMMNEASHHPLLSAQRDALRAKEASERADDLLNALQANTDLTEAYSARRKALNTLAEGLNVYNAAKVQLPKYIVDQDLWMKSEFYDLCDQLEWGGSSAFKKRVSKSNYRKLRRAFKPIIRRVKRIDCAVTSSKRVESATYKGELELTTYLSNRKPKGSALMMKYQIEWIAKFDDMGEMTLERFEPSSQEDKHQLVESPPLLNRARIAKRYKLHKPKLRLKKDYNICSLGIEAYKRRSEKSSPQKLVEGDVVLSMSKVKRGWRKIKILGQRDKYLPADQNCVQLNRQDGNLRSIYRESHTFDTLKVSELPSKKGHTRILKDVSLYIFEENMGERKKWAQGWVLNGDSAGRRAFVQTVNLTLPLPEGTD